jgi:prepilin-type N-terminal cleavage/methylation domain-containing protein/prepilin-type processing-associated H-X9-DG protein
MKMPVRHLRQRSIADSSRAGFSLVELLVVITIIAILLSLALPAVQQSRASARRITCLNHLRQVATAVISNCDQNDRFPAAGLFSVSGGTMYHNWVTAILPQIDQASLYQSYDQSKPYTDDTNFELTRTHLAVLTCPDDFSVVPGEGNLSFVVNGGVGWTVPIDCPARARVVNDRVEITPFDLNGNGVVCPLNQEPGPEPSDLSLLEDLSLFFLENWPTGQGTKRFHRMKDITDGLSTTIMLAENIRAGYDPNAQTSWGSPEPLRSMFFVSSAICEEGVCTPDRVDLGRANSRAGEPESRECINSGLTQAEGTAPWPTSGHPGLVHVAWCDGHVSPLSEHVDGRVYFSMITPRGTVAPAPFTDY